MSDNDDTIFDSETPKTEEQKSNEPSAFTVPDGVTEFVGEGKKYASVEDALKSVPHAQSHIERLEEELKEMRAELEKRATVEEVLAKVKANATVTEERPSSSEVDPEAIRAMVADAVTTITTEEKQKENELKASNALREAYGEKATETLVNKATELGISVDDARSLARKSPSAFFNLMGLNSKPESSFNKKTDSSVNTEAFKQEEQKPSIKVNSWATTDDLTSAWRAAKPQI